MQLAKYALTPLLLLVACSSTGDEQGGPEQPGQADAATEPESNPFGEGGDCPDLVAGENSITVNGSARTFTIALPAEPTGASVVYAWHWLGGTANQTLQLMGMAGLADKGAIVVAPTSSGLQFEWDFLAGPEASVDLALFDELQRCIWETWQMDTNRIYSTGMSAGGLFTSYLSLHRSEQLAATVPFSGGAPNSSYSTPANALPVMIVWGGVGDTFGGFDFNGSSLEFSQSLRNDGHFVVECMHTGAHTPPAEAADMAWTFFEAHPMGVAPDPWLGGLPTSMPSYCRIP